MANLTQTTAEVQTILNTAIRPSVVIGTEGSSDATLLFPHSGVNTGRAVIDLSANTNTDASIDSTLYIGFNIDGLTWNRIDANDKALFWGLERHYLPTPGGHFWAEAYLQYQFEDGHPAEPNYRRPFMSVIDKNDDLILSTSICGGSDGLSLSVNDGTGTDQQKVTGKEQILIKDKRVMIGCIAPINSPYTGRMLTVDDDTTGGCIEIATSATDNAGIAAGILSFSSRNNTGGLDARVAQIYALTIGTTANTRGGELLFCTKIEGTNDYIAEAMRISNNRKVGIGVTAPTAFLHLKACAAAANSASLKIDAGTVATNAVSGNIESDGTHLYWTDSGGTRRQLDN